jgi:hypothetical protein
MKLFYYMAFVISIQLIISCNDISTNRKKEVRVKDSKLEVQDSLRRLPLPSSELKVDAYLIYNDGTTSSFDVLNDKSIALWNVIIGGGDAEKPSDKVKLVLTGSFDSLLVVVKNGQRIVLREKNVKFSGDMIYKINNTGCDEVVVNIQRNNVLKYNDTIPFRCGE